MQIMEDNQSRPLLSSPVTWSDSRISEGLFCLCLVSVFLPVKLYPIVLLISCFFFYREIRRLPVQPWLIFLGIYSLSAVTSFLFFYNGERALVTNLAKLLINFIFLYFAVSWLQSRDNKHLLRLVDLSLGLIFLLVFVQLIVYHQAMDFRLLYGSSSSGQASSLYNKSLYFWGLDDKNMFGARIAMLGFPFTLIPFVRSRKISWWRIVGIFLLAYMSLSRTPIVALLIGVFLLIWLSTGTRWRIILVFSMILVLPFVLEKLIRIDNLTSSNDGMGIRLVYWKAFFTHFTEISPWGNGFMQAPEFLREYADFYRGEPHIHNTFLTSYLELGIIGLVSYILFLIYFYKDCQQLEQAPKFWWMVFIPLLSIMMILYSGYDNDIVLYLTMAILLGSISKVDFKTTRMGL